MRFLSSLLVLLAFCATPLAAQEDDKGYITNFLESSLAGAGRTVQINGFEGVLSKRATVSSIRILDDEGVWLEMNDIALQLNRSALLRGRVEVEELSAKTIELSRMPIAAESELPPAEAQGFSLPDLPVSIDVKLLQADKIILGTPVLGEAAELDLTASLSLIDGEAIANLSANRTDGKRGSFVIDASFQNEEALVDLNINLDEGEGGIAARLLGLPDNPSTQLSIEGSGPLNDLVTDIKIATDGTERLTGKVQLSANAPTAEGATVSRDFYADVSGDVTALFAPQYRPFFGDAVTLVVEGNRGADGALTLSVLDLETQALNLSGAAKLNRDFWPESIDLTGRIGNDTNTAVTLPLPGGETTLREALLAIQFDENQGSAWSGNFQVTDLTSDGTLIANTDLKATGVLDGKVNAVGQVTAALDLAISGIEFEDPALMAAVGDQIDGKLDIEFIEDQPLTLSNLAIKGENFDLLGEAQIDTLGEGLKTTFDTRLMSRDISQFSDIVGRPLDGAVEVMLSGSADLGGTFDVLITGTANDLGVGQDQADKLLRGTTNLSIKSDRNEVGTRVEQLLLDNAQVKFDGSGLLTGDGADLKFSTSVKDTSLLVNALEGAATVSGTASEREGQWTLDVDGTGPFSSTLSVEGVATGPNAKVNFAANLPDINPFVPQYRGAASLSGVAQNSAQGWLLDTSISGPYGLTAKLDGRVTGENAPSIRYSANLPDVSPIIPKVNGPLSLNGDIQQRTSDLWDVTADIDGPSGTQLQANGTVSSSGLLDISVGGNAPLALANPFLTPRAISGTTALDLRVRGPADLGSVSGTVRVSDGRFVDPDLQLALERIGANISVSNGRANLAVNADVSSGGSITVSGPLGLTGQLPSNLQVDLNSVVLEDPSLYKTLLSGRISVDGSLLSNARISGQIDVGETLISVPSTGVSSFGTIPNITHVNAPTAVRRTLSKAGLTEKATTSSTARASYPLDITILAPQRIFVRGRGLDAELGGRLRLRGTTTNIISAGRFELVRGRLDILSKRFELDEGIIQLQGDFDPFLRFVATTITTSGTASVIVEGSASDPDVRFESTPDAPQDEVLAQIFFGRDVSQISALQALQLASAVATLAGNGGEGIVSKLRRGFDLDDLDFTTDDEGNAALRAGKYISDNVYTDVTIGTQNNAEVSLNIDLTPSIKATGKLGSDGDTSIGIYFEKDY